MQNAVVHETVVGQGGRIEVQTDLTPGIRARVIVCVDETADLVAAASSSLQFWDNPIDDEDWNDARPG